MRSMMTCSRTMMSDTIMFSENGLFFSVHDFKQKLIKKSPLKLLIFVGRREAYHSAKTV